MPDYTESLIRLHILADSDEPSAQALKLAVRDEVLAFIRPLLQPYGDPDSAYDCLRDYLPFIQSHALDFARALDPATTLSAQLGVFPFPDRDYDGCIVPAGDYRALRIVIGEGAGRNWWCILFPSLCVPSGGGVSILADWFHQLSGGFFQ